MFLIKLYEKIQEYQCNLTNKTIKINNIHWSYYDNLNKNKPIIIIFHGFQSNKKYTWYPIIKQMTKNFRIIIPDLIGHGDTKILSNVDEFDFSISNFINQLKLFIDNVIGKNYKFHLIGSSFGGMLASIISASYPISVLSLTLYTTFGTKFDNNLVLQIYTKTKTNILIPNTIDEFDIFTDLIFYKKPFIMDNNISMNWHLNERKDRKDIYNNILFTILLKDPYILDKYIKIIKQPVLIIWGKNDKILDISSVKHLYNELPNKPKIHIFDKCGHLIHYEYPIKCSKLTKQHILRNNN